MDCFVVFLGRFKSSIQVCREEIKLRLLYFISQTNCKGEDFYETAYPRHD